MPNTLTFRRFYVALVITILLATLVTGSTYFLLVPLFTLITFLVLA